MGRGKLANKLSVGIILWIHNIVKLGSGDKSVLTGEFWPMSKMIILGVITKGINQPVPVLPLSLSSYKRT